MEQQVGVTIYGYHSSMRVQNLTGTKGQELHMALQDYRNVSGPVSLFIFQGGEWVLLDTINAPTEEFVFPADFPLGTYALKVVFGGNAIYEPCEVVVTLILEVDFAALFHTLGLIIGAIGLSAFVLMLAYYRQQSKRAKAERNRQLKAECEREREEKRQLAREPRIAAKEPIDDDGEPIEPDVVQN